MFQEKIKELIVQKDDGNSKKKIENLVVLIIILIVTVLCVNSIWNKDNKQKSYINETTTKQLADKSEKNETENYDLQKNIENILSNMEGVGRVNVLITYSESSQTVAMYNENSKDSSTEEKDDKGATRIIKQVDTNKDIIYKEVNGEKIPITQKTINPKIEGAVVTAEGATNSNVKSNIIQAVEAATGLATHKIQVFEMRKE